MIEDLNISGRISFSSFSDVFPSFEFYDGCFGCLSVLPLGFCLTFTSQQSGADFQLRQFKTCTHRHLRYPSSVHLWNLNMFPELCYAYVHTSYYQFCHGLYTDLCIHRGWHHFDRRFLPLSILEWNSKHWDPHCELYWRGNRRCSAPSLLRPLRPLTKPWYSDFDDYVYCVGHHYVDRGTV